MNVVNDTELEKMQNMQAIMDNDVRRAVQFIRTHQQKDNIIDMYRRGPPEDTGFMWLQDGWFTPKQQQGFQVMKLWILAHDYDSSAYAYMHRAIQHALNPTATDCAEVQVPEACYIYANQAFTESVHGESNIVSNTRARRL